MLRRSRLTTLPRMEQLDQRCVLSALTPSQIQAAYGLNSTGLTGAGQVIAIIDAYADPNIQTEINDFDTANGLPSTSVAVTNLGSANNTNAGWEEEEALDVEAAHLAAPGAKILLIEAKSSNTSDLMAAVATANSTAGVTVVSMSWGGSDTSSETAYDSYFTHTGITYLAASGDSGSGAEWPSDSPNVVAVGGTTLSVTTSGRSTETAWSDSGGGTSRVETEPTFQDKAQSTGYRTTPDVSADADPNTGLEMYTVAGGGWVQVGGTSLATPLWAGIIAQADQGRVSLGKTSLSSTQTLADLYEAPSGSFFDVTSGSRASSSYDTSTGLGTPNAKVLVAALASDPATGSSTTGNGVGGDPLPVTTTTPVTTSPTTPTTPTAPPRNPWQPPYGGGRGGYRGGYGFATGGGWAGASVPSNSGQAITDPFLPITPIETDPGTGETPPPVATQTGSTGTGTSTTTGTGTSTTTGTSHGKTTTKAKSSKPTSHSPKATTETHHAVDAVIHSLGHR